MRNIIMSHESDEREEFKPVKVDGKARVVGRRVSERTPHWKEGKDKQTERFLFIDISYIDDTVENVVALARKQYEDPDVTGVYVNKALWSRADIDYYVSINKLFNKKEEENKDREAVDELLKEQEMQQA